MQIVIDIPDGQYEYLSTIAEDGQEPLGYFERVIMRGTPLPKGHGKIIDADKLKQKIEMADDHIMEEDWYKLYDSVISDIDTAYAIIEADKAESEW